MSNSHSSHSSYSSHSSVAHAVPESERFSVLRKPTEEVAAQLAELGEALLEQEAARRRQFWVGFGIVLAAILPLGFGNLANAAGEGESANQMASLLAMLLISGLALVVLLMRYMEQHIYQGQLARRFASTARQLDQQGGLGDAVSRIGDPRLSQFLAEETEKVRQAERNRMIAGPALFGAGLSLHRRREESIL